MKELSIVPFNEDNVNRILPLIGYSLDNQDRIIYEDKVKSCGGCGTELTKRNLGNIFPGSHILFCDNPFCITGYVREKFLKR